MADHHQFLQAHIKAHLHDATSRIRFLPWRMANDSLVSKSTQPVSEINTGAGKNNTIKHELAKQLNDYRNKQRDSYSQMNRQRGQGAAENRQRGQNAAGVNPQRSHNKCRNESKQT